MENPFKIDDLGVPPFWETSKWIFKILIAHNSWKIVEFKRKYVEKQTYKFVSWHFKWFFFRQCEISKGYIV